MRPGANPTATNPGLLMGQTPNAAAQASVQGTAATAGAATTTAAASAAASTAAAAAAAAAAAGAAGVTGAAGASAVDTSQPVVELNILQQLTLQLKAHIFQQQQHAAATGQPMQLNAPQQKLLARVQQLQAKLRLAQLQGTAQFSAQQQQQFVQLQTILGQIVAQAQAGQLLGRRTEQNKNPDELAAKIQSMEEALKRTQMNPQQREKFLMIKAKLEEELANLRRQAAASDAANGRAGAGVGNGTAQQQQQQQSAPVYVPPKGPPMFPIAPQYSTRVFQGPPLHGFVDVPAAGLGGAGLAAGAAGGPGSTASKMAAILAAAAASGTVLSAHQLAFLQQHQNQQMQQMQQMQQSLPAAGHTPFTLQMQALINQRKAEQAGLVGGGGGGVGGAGGAGGDPPVALTTLFRMSNDDGSSLSSTMSSGAAYGRHRDAFLDAIWRRPLPNGVSLPVFGGKQHKRRLQTLVARLDPEMVLDAEMEDLFLCMADDFIEQVAMRACRTAKHRRTMRLEVADVQLELGGGCFAYRLA
nr:Transcription initiation factor TFIID subunit 12 [Polyrhizophydium stewartii]